MGIRQQIGRWGEQIAAEYLSARGMRLLERNARTPHGELDLVFADGDVLVFVEVKTRTGMGFGFPEESVTAQKRLHLVQAAQAYIQNCGDSDADVDWRIDVIAVQGRPGSGEPKVVWFEDAVR
jgi:putative endonuclease